MLIREDDRGLLAIGQPSHAWLSGQLARSWGNEQFGDVHPYEEVCLAAEQHDLGWGARDQAPLLDPDNGAPRSFMRMPLELHLEMFTDGPRRMLSQSRYAALLVSLHGWRLYERRDPSRLQEGRAQAIREFLASQKDFQAQLLEALRADAATAPLADEDQVRRNSMLIWTWDYLSLALCLDWDPATAKKAPTATGDVDLQLQRQPGSGRWRLSPWPFAVDSLRVRCEGRRLDGRYQDEAAMRAALREARWETLERELIPG